MQLIRKIALDPERVTVVITHDARVFGFGDRIITLEDGRVAKDKRTEPALPQNMATGQLRSEP